jgi:RNA polymerase sigma-70 factor (ECF subfamily)
LPARQANAIVLTRIEGRSIAEAAQISGQSESNVKVSVHRGLRKLAAMVESE